MIRLVTLSLACVLLGGLAAGAVHEPGTDRGAPRLTSADIRDAGRPSMRIFSSVDGLPQNAINTISEDVKGYLWVGTKDGAARYDGHAWKPVTLPKDVGLNDIKSILSTPDGNTWFATAGGGIARLGPGGKWTIFRGSDGLPSEHVLALYAGTSLGTGHEVIAVTSLGIAGFDGSRWVAYEQTAGTHVGTSYLRTLDGGSKELWADVEGPDAVRLSDGNWSRAPDGAGSRNSDGDVLCYGESTTIDGSPRLLAGNANGATWFDGQRWHDIEPPDRDFTLISGIRDTQLPDGSTALYLAAPNVLYRYLNGRWTRYDARYGYPSTTAWSTLATGDRTGTQSLWIGTSGIGLIRLQLGLWTTFDHTSGLDHDSVYALLLTEDRQKNDVLWVGTVDGGIYRLSAGASRNIALPNGASGTWAHCLLADDQDGRERVWAGTDFATVLIEDGRVARTFETDPVERYGPVQCLAFSSLPDGRRRLWVGSTKGLFRIDGTTRTKAPDGLALAGASISCLTETESPVGSRVMWIGTDRGLERFDGRSSTVLTMANGLPSNAITSARVVTIPGLGRELWIGTRAGLARLTLGVTPAVVRVVPAPPEAPALDRTVYRVEQDAAGRIYATTNAGVVQFTPREPTPDDSSAFGVYVFTTRDGLPHDECNTGASYVDDRGRVWVGTLHGASVFDPALDVVATSHRQLVMQRQSVVSERDRQLVADESLPYDSTHVRFEFALLSFSREDATRYRTQLVGYEDVATAWTTENTREFTGLPAGPYMFRAWAMDAFGNISGPVDTPFSVRPAPWLEPWALAACAAALVMLGYGSVRWRLYMLKKRTDALETAIADRTAELALTVEELRESQDEALSASRAKSIFLANISHELRTPLNAVLGFAQLLDRSTTLAEADRRHVGIISRSGEHLLGLINDVLSLAKIEAGKLDLNAQPFAPRALFEAVEGIVRVRAEAKELALTFTVDDGFPETAVGDETRLRQVLINLLGNAVKFTDRGEVSLTATWRDGIAHFDIVDTGSGIEADELESLFRAFSQTTSGRVSSEGTGLGLALSREIVRAMGGDLMVASVWGEGTTFTFDVRMPATDQPTFVRDYRRVARVHPAERRRRVLVVDDSAENRLFLGELLRGVGFDVREAEDGREAVDVTLTWRPRVIFMDHRMPVMNGSEATREIRRSEAAASQPVPFRTTIIATTASAFEQERASILADGCDDLLIKPFTEAEVFDRLRLHANIAFEYEDEEPDEAPEGAMSLGTLGAALRMIDRNQLDRLQRALALGDAVEAERTAAEIGRSHSMIGAEIQRRIRAFEIDDLLSMLEREAV